MQVFARMGHVLSALFIFKYLILLYPPCITAHPHGQVEVLTFLNILFSFLSEITAIYS